MHSLSAIALACLALAAQVVESKSTVTHCATALGAHPVDKVRTKVSTSTQPCTGQSTVTKTVTASTTIGTATELIIYTTTPNHGTSVSTVPTSPDFIPVQTSAPNTTYNSKYGGTDPNVVKRSENLLLRDADAQKPVALFGSKKQRYVNEISCKEVVAASSCTSTVTVTSTKIVGASKTVTTTTTSSIYSTTTTAYAACATNNLANTYNGKSILNFNVTAQTQEMFGSSAYASYYTYGVLASAADCCVETFINTPEPEIFFFIPNATYAKQYGYNCASYSYNQSCPAVQPELAYNIETAPNVAGPIVLGNLNCAEFVPPGAS